MPHARCKFKVVSVLMTGKEYGTEDKSAETITLSTHSEENEPEDTKFSAATPIGKLEFKLTNPNLLGQFQPGQSYYIDLVPIEEPG